MGRGPSDSMVTRHFSAGRGESRGPSRRKHDSPLYNFVASTIGIAFCDRLRRKQMPCGTAHERLLEWSGKRLSLSKSRTRVEAVVYASQAGLEDVRVNLGSR